MQTRLMRNLLFFEEFIKCTIVKKNNLFLLTMVISKFETLKFEIGLGLGVGFHRSSSNIF